MRRLSALLSLLVALTACAAPTTQNENIDHSSYKVTLDGTFGTSLLVTQWESASQGNILFPLDPRSGTALTGYEPISLGQTPFHTFAPDRRTLAVVTFPGNSMYDGSLLLIDLMNWSTRQLDLELSGWVSAMDFSPDGKQLAIAHGETNFKITTVDIEQGIITAKTQTQFIVTQLKYTCQGAALMLYSPTVDAEQNSMAGPPLVQLLNAIDLTTRWSATLEDVHDGIFPKDGKVSAENLYELGQALYLSPGLVFAPDRDTLYIVHADSEKLTIVDFEAQTVKSMDIHPRLTWFERLLALSAGAAHAKVGDGISRQVTVSADGKFLYVVGVNYASFQDQNGSWQFEQTNLGLEILDARDGSRVDRIEIDATELSLSPDGEFLYLRNWGNNQDNIPWTAILDTASREIITQKTGVCAFPARLTNGEYLLVSEYATGETSHHMSVMELDGSPVLSEWTDTNYLWWMTTP